MQWCTVKNQNKNVCAGLFTHLHALLQRHGKTHVKKNKTKKKQKSVEIQVSFKGTFRPKNARSSHPSSGCSASGPWSSCCSRGPHCAASRCSEPPRGARVLENKKSRCFFQQPLNAPPAAQSPRGVEVLTFLGRRTWNLLRVLSVTHDPATGACITWRSGIFTELDTPPRGGRETDRCLGVRQVGLTLLVRRHPGLGLLHVHHDGALPASLRVHGHLVTCQTGRS